MRTEIFEQRGPPASPKDAHQLVDAVANVAADVVIHVVVVSNVGDADVVALDVVEISPVRETPGFVGAPLVGVGSEPDARAPPGLPEPLRLALSLPLSPPSPSVISILTMK